MVPAGQLTLADPAAELAWVEPAGGDEALGELLVVVGDAGVVEFALPEGELLTFGLDD
jgi:hypothetical protein